MAAKPDEDDYWTSSVITALDFDDDDDTKLQLASNNKQFERLALQVRADLSDDDVLQFNQGYQPPSPTEIPLHSLISDEALINILTAQSGDDPTTATIIPSEELRILRRKVRNMFEPDEPEKILQKMLLGRRCMLENCKSLKSKTDLLDAAVELGDGDSIMGVVLFMQRTLKRKLFHQILSTRPIAAQHYASYISTRGQINDLTEFLQMLGKSNETAIKSFMYVCSQPVGVKLPKLRQCYSTYVMQPGVDQHISSMVKKYISLLEWQSNTLADPSAPPLGSSTIHSLSWVSKTHWNSNGPLDQRLLADQQQIAPMQYDWTVLLARASKEEWKDVESIVIKKGIFKNQQISTQIPLEKVITQLHSISAPAKVLETFLNLLTEPKKSEISRSINLE